MPLLPNVPYLGQQTSNIFDNLILFGNCHFWIHNDSPSYWASKKHLCIRIKPLPSSELKAVIIGLFWILCNSFFQKKKWLERAKKLILDKGTLSLKNRASQQSINHLPLTRNIVIMLFHDALLGVPYMSHTALEG